MMPVVARRDLTGGVVIAGSLAQRPRHGGYRHPTASIEVMDVALSDSDRRRLCGRDENQGSAGARNEGIRLSRDSYLVFLDADNRSLPDALEVGPKHSREDVGQPLIDEAYNHRWTYEWKQMSWLLPVLLRYHPRGFAVTLFEYPSGLAKGAFCPSECKEMF